MKDYNFITIQGWMLNKLKLSGNELLVYSIIYGFSQDGNSVFKGTSSYLSETLNISSRQVLDILDKLVKKGFIIKIKNGIYNDYKTNLDILEDINNKKNNNGKEEEKKEENKEKKKKETQFNFNVEEYIDNEVKLDKQEDKEKLKYLLQIWMEYRKSIKKPLNNEYSIKILISKYLRQFNNDLERLGKAIEFSIANKYQGIFEEFKSNKNQRVNSGNINDINF